ncbi:myophilin-like [Haliotis asinina]|uniref:myophilin-like n=1 Tax=Haliotis asinina TaxID=109174 RepID=UPI003531991A
MAGLRAPKAGSARDAQIRIDASFDPVEGRKCLEWIRELTGENFVTDAGPEKYRVMDNFWKVLRDGFLLCKVLNVVVPDNLKCNFNAPTFRPTANPQFQAARERERIELYNRKLEEFGVAPDNCFLVDCLYERTNLWQVAASIRALGTEFESRPSFTGMRWWPRKAEANPRNFSEEVLNAGNTIINLQYGSNKGASAKGMNFGKKRMIMKE